MRDGGEGGVREGATAGDIGVREGEEMRVPNPNSGIYMKL